MRWITWILLFVLLFACSTTHKIRIPKLPCLYPHEGFDFTICHDFAFYVDDIRTIVPTGFTTDLASIPRILWSVYSPNKANTIPGSVIHDYLYFCPNKITRKQADSIFFDALIYKGVKPRTAFKYWVAVRAFGKNHFNEGAICTHDYSRTKNTIGHLRMARAAAPKLIAAYNKNRQRRKENHRRPHASQENGVA